VSERGKAKMTPPGESGMPAHLPRVVRSDRPPHSSLAKGDVRCNKNYFAVRLSSNLIDSPQPQASVTLGLLNLNPDSSNDVS